MEHQNDYAKEYGMPCFALCKKLDWQFPTEYCWIEINGKWCLFLSDSIPSMNSDEHFYAPKISDIAGFLSKKGNVVMNGSVLSYDDTFKEKRYTVKVVKNDYVSAFVELCFLLKKHKAVNFKAECTDIVVNIRK